MTALVPATPAPLGAVRRWCAGRRATAPAALPAYRLLAVLALPCAALAAALGFAVAGPDLARIGALLAGGAALAWAMRWCRLPRPADALEAGAAILAGAVATGCLSVLLATLAPPLRDAALARADRLLFPFLSWPAMAGALRGHPAVVAAMQRVYSTLLWQPFALAALLAAAGRSATVWRFVHAWLLALVACLAVFALVPALAAQAHYGVAHAVPGLTLDTGWRPAALLGRVRDGSLRVLASGSMTGLVTFPSFHAAGATLLGWGWAQAGAPGRPLVALNLAMIPAIPLVGSHYFVDVAAGIALAGLVIAATRPRVAA